MVVTAEGVGVMPLVVKVMDVAKYSTEPSRIFSPPPGKGGGGGPSPDAKVGGGALALAVRGPPPHPPLCVSHFLSLTIHSESHTVSCARRPSVC